MGELISGSLRYLLLYLLSIEVGQGKVWGLVKRSRAIILHFTRRVVQYSSLVRVENVPFRLVQVGRFHNLLFYL